MKYPFFNMLLAALWLAVPVHAAEGPAPVDFRGLYEFNYGGMVFGRMGIEAEQKTSEDYALTCDIATTGVLKFFVPHTSHTTVSASASDKSYDTRYQTKKKPKSVSMTVKNGRIVAESALPADSDRPAVAAELKNAAVDPLSFLLAMRNAIWEARQKGTQNFSLNVYDGRRLTQVDFTMAGKKTIEYGGQQRAVLAVNMRRKLLQGFTPKEMSKADPKEPLLHVYVSDDERLVPLKLEATPWFGLITATLVKECAAGESCLLGNKE